MSLQLVQSAGSRGTPITFINKHIIMSLFLTFEIVLYALERAFSHIILCFHGIDAAIG